MQAIELIARRKKRRSASSKDSGEGVGPITEEAPPSASTSKLTAEFYAAALELNPNNSKAWYELGLLLSVGADRCHEVHGKRHSARDCFEFAVRLNPADADIWFHLGVCLRSGTSTDACRVLIKGVWLGARECFEQCVRIDKDDSAAWYNLGATLGTFDETNRIGDRVYQPHECYEAALCISDKDPKAWFNLGVTLPSGRASCEIGGETYTPRQCFETSILLDPRDPDVWYNLGCALERPSDLSAPLRDGKQFTRQQCFELTLRMNSKHKLAWYNLGVLLSSMSVDGGSSAKSHSIGAGGSSRRYTAKECFEEAVCVDAMWKEAWFNLGLCVPQDGFTSKAIRGRQYTKTQCFEIAVRIDQKYAAAWAELGMALEDGCYSSPVDDTGRRYSKQRCFETALTLDMNNAMYWYSLGLTLQHCEGTAESGDMRRHRWSREIEGYTYNQQLCFERSLMLDSSPAAVWNDLGVALPSTPDDATSNVLDGRCYKKQHCFEASLERDAISPAAAAAWYNLAARLALGADNAAQESNAIQGVTYSRRKCLELALDLDNLHAEAWLQLGVVLPHSESSDAEDGLTSVVHGERVGKQQCLERSIRIATLSRVNEAEAWNRLGVVLPRNQTVNMSGILYDCRGCFQASLRLDPLQAEPWFNLGVALPTGRKSDPLGHDEGFTEQECFEQALRLNPEHPSAWHNLGVTLPNDAAVTSELHGQRYTRLLCFVKAVGLEKMDWEHWMSIGECLLRQDQRRRATAAASSPVNNVEHNSGGSTATYRNNSSSKRKLAASLSNGDHALASIVLFNRRWTAVDCAVRAVEYANMRSPEAWVSLGRSIPNDSVEYNVEQNRDVKTASTVVIAGRPHTKQACFEAALGLNPRHVDAWYYLGCVVPAGGTTEDLGGHTYTEQECFEQVLRFDPTNADAWFNVGLLMGDPTQHKASCAPKYRDVVSNDIHGRVFTKQQCFEACLSVSKLQHAAAWYYLGMVLPKVGRCAPLVNPLGPHDDSCDVSDLVFSKQECFEHAIQICPEDGKAWCELAMLLPEQGGWSNDIAGHMYSKHDCTQRALALQYRSGEGGHLFSDV